MTDPGTLPFAERDIREAFSTSNVLRGERYVRQGRVSGVVVSNSGATIAAAVRGSRATPYIVTAYATRRRGAQTRLTGYCDCPIGADCKHVAATFFAALENAGAPSRVVRSLATASDTRVDLWLADVRASVAGPTIADKHGDERVAYLFVSHETGVARNLNVKIVRVRRAENGRFAHESDLTPETLGYAMAPNIRADDLVIGRLLQIYATTSRGRAALGDEIVRRIVSTGLAFLDDLAGPALTLGHTRIASVAWITTADGMQRAALAFDDEGMQTLPAPVAWYVTREGETGIVDAGMPREALHALLDGPALDASHIARVRDALAEALPRLVLPQAADLIERVERIAPVPTLRLRGVEANALRSAAAQSGLFAEPLVDVAEFTFAYGAAIVDPRSNEPKIRHVASGEAVVYVRDTFAETLATKRLAVAGLEPDSSRRFGPRTAGQLFRYAENLDWQWSLFLYEAVPKLRALGWIVEIDPTFHHRVVDLANDEAWHPAVRQAGDGWFDLALGIDIDGKRYDLLPMLSGLLERGESLDAMRAPGDGAEQQTYYVSVGDEATTLALPYARVRAIVDTLVELGDPGVLAEGRMRVPRARTGLVNELETASGLRWNAPERMRELADRLRAFGDLERIAVPESFVGTLRPYQRDGLDWLQFLGRYELGGVLADDMGLGKSVQTLAHLLCEKEAGRLTQPALLVVPTSLVYNWRDEAARFAPSLRVLSLNGPDRAERFADIAASDVAITTYALLTRDRILFERTWHAAVFDEAQAMKNPLSKVARAAIEVRAGHRLCLTGTPVENTLGDLWSLYAIALPGLLGDRKTFNRSFRIPIEKRANVARGKALTARIRPFLMRRTKEAVAPELPEKTEIVQRVELTGAQRDLYETVRVAMSERVRDEIAEHGIAKSQIVILDALLKLRQVCCDPRLLPERFRKVAESVKLELLRDLLPQAIADGRRVLVFSQFTSMLDIVARALVEDGIGYVTLTGETTDREAVVKRFQAGDVPVFLISLKAGGVGLNLTAADTVIHYDPWWNPAVERQATDRAHRIGQTRPVFVYKLICAGTVEEKIVDLQTRKAELAAAIFSEDVERRTNFTTEDIARLFAPLVDR